MPPDAAKRITRRHRVYTFLSLEGVEVHHGDTESTEGARRFEISNLRFEISNLKPPCNLRVLRASVVNYPCSKLKIE
jgi:hypothetical protein